MEYCCYIRHAKCQSTNRGGKWSCWNVHEHLSEMWKPCLFGQERTYGIFVTSETGLSIRTFVFQNDLLFLKVTSQLHHLSIKCAIHVLHVNKFNPHCLHRRPADEVRGCTSCPGGPKSGHLEYHVWENEDGTVTKWTMVLEILVPVSPLLPLDTLCLMVVTKPWSPTLTQGSLSKSS